MISASATPRRSSTHGCARRSVPTFGINVLHALLADTGLTARRFTTSTRPEIATAPIRSSSLDIEVPTGGVIGFTDVDEVETYEGPRLTFEMTGKLYREGEADSNDWTITGEPELRLSNPAGRRA